MGATLYAAKLSTSFRLRDFAITDAFPQAISIRLAGGAEADKSDEEDAEEKVTSKSKDKLLFKVSFVIARAAAFRAERRRVR